jgi:molybdopterin-guanine dinucleotide biosynthesis protein A/molybdopterin converting factor small subunit
LGTDKAMIHFQGATLLEKLVKEVKQLANKVIVVSNDVKHHKYNTTEVIEQNPLGPLNGLLNGLKECNTDWVLVLSVDMPLLNLSDLVDSLKTKVNETSSAIIPNIDGKAQYLAGFYRIEVLSNIEKLIASSQYSMKSLIKNFSKVILISGCKNNFANINSIEDIQQENLSLVKVIPFGMLQEVLNIDNCSMLTNAKTIEKFKMELETNYPKIKNASYRIALNQKLEPEGTQINSNDEIALLPPFAGG